MADTEIQESGATTIDAAAELGGSAQARSADDVKADHDLLAQMGLEDDEIQAMLDPADDQDEEGEEGEDGGQPTAAPESLKIGDAEVPVADVTAAFQEHSAWKAAIDPVVDVMRAGGVDGASYETVVEAAQVYVGEVAHFNRSAAGAMEVIGGLVSAAVELHGKDAADYGEIDDSILDPEQLDGQAKALYGALKAEQARAAQLEDKLSKMADEGKTLIDRVTTLETAPTLASAYREVDAESTLDGKGVMSLCEKYGLPKTADGARNAAKLHALDNPRPAKADGQGKGDGGAKTAKTPPGAGLPKRSEEKVVDMKGLSIEERNRLMQLGYSHKKGAQPWKPRQQSEKDG